MEETLAKLMEREEPFVARLPREPGRRESRYAQLLCGEIPAATPSGADAEAIQSDRERLDLLERRVAELADELDGLKQHLTEREHPPTAGHG